MGRKTQYISLNRVLSKIYRDSGFEEIDETDAIEWAGEALEFINAVTAYEEAIAFIEVKNYQAMIPERLHTIIQVAKDNAPTISNDICPNVVIQNITIEQEQNNTPVPLDCNGMPITDYELAYYRPYFDLQYEYYGWSNCRLYKERFTPLRLSNHSFFNSLVCQEDKQLYNNCNIYDEYTIANDNIRTSFKDGLIALAYYRQKVDPETGYPMIPDEVSIITAITYYIIWKYTARMWYLGKEGYGDKMKVAEQQWQWYCKQSGNKQMMLHGIDQHQNFTENRFSLIPNKNKYYNFFGKLGRNENLNSKFRGI